jgi:predicted transcriptional regulator of viral defense system
MMEPISIIMGLAQFAPSIIRWVTGNEKAENVAKTVVDIASTVAGTEDGASIIERLKADAKLAAEFAERIEQRSHDLQIAYLADVDSARKMQMEALKQDDVFSKRFIYYFATAWNCEQSPHG